MAKVWTEAETAYLEAHWKADSVAKMAQHLGRSVSSVYGKLGLMGIKASKRGTPAPAARYPHPRRCVVSDGFCERSMCCYDCRNQETCKNACQNNPRHCGCTREWNE